MDERTRKELAGALDAFARGMEKVAEAYLNEVARAIAASLKAATVDLSCPRLDPHAPHAWRFRDGVVARRCIGVVDLIPERCLKTSEHEPHTWEHVDGDLGVRACPGYRLPVRHCLDNLAHHEHNHTTTGTRDGVVWCPGLEYDRETQWCGHQALHGEKLEHAPHEWGPEGTGPLVFCTGLPTYQARPCSRILQHEPHTHAVPIDETRSVLCRCPGKGPLVPAGPDRFA